MFSRVGDLNIYYQTVGFGRDLVFLHGWKNDVSSFWPMVEFLKSDFKLWLLDLPGFGWSDSPQESWGTEKYADFMANFLTTNKIKKPILFGHSMGGKIAVLTAARHPDLISELILEASSGLKNKDSFRNFLAKIAAKATKRLAPNWFNFKEKLRYRLYKLLGSDYYNARNLRRTFLRVAGGDVSESAKKIKARTLIIWGEEDKSVPLKFGKKFYQLIPNSRLEVLEGLGHTPHGKSAKIVATLIKDFCL